MRVSPARGEDLNNILLIINAEVNTGLKYDPPVVKLFVDVPFDIILGFYKSFFVIFVENKRNYKDGKTVLYSAEICFPLPVFQITIKTENGNNQRYFAKSTERVPKCKTLNCRFTLVDDNI